MKWYILYLDSSFPIPIYPHHINICSKFLELYLSLNYVTVIYMFFCFCFCFSYNTRNNIEYNYLRSNMNK